MNMAELKPVKAGRTFKVTVISAMFYFNEKGKFVGNLSVVINGWKEKL